MGETARGETPFGPTFPSTTSKQPNIPNIFIDYKRCLELDASLHTQKWILPHAKYHCVLKYFWDKEFAAGAAKWELLTGMKQTLTWKFWSFGEESFCIFDIRVVDIFSRIKQQLDQNC